MRNAGWRTGRTSCTYCLRTLSRLRNQVALAEHLVDLRGAVRMPFQHPLIRVLKGSSLLRRFTERRGLFELAPKRLGRHRVEDY